MILNSFLMITTALSCPTLDEVKNGQTKYFPSHVVHKCSRGYQLFGSTVQRCLPTGTWSGNTPVCIRKGKASTIIHTGISKQLTVPVGI